MKRNMLNRLVIWVVLLSGLLVGCSGESDLAKESSVADRNLNLMYSTKQKAENNDAGTASIPRAVDRKLIYNADLNIEVADLASARKQVEELVKTSEGYVLSFSDRTNPDLRGGDFQVKVPAGQLQSFIDELEKMELISFERSIRAEDVGEEYVDLQARLKVKQAVEARMIELMEKATSSGDLIAFAVKLGDIQVEIETLKGRIQYIDRNVAFSTVNISLFERLYGVPASGASYVTKLWYELKAGLYGVGHFFANGLLVLTAMIPTLILLTGIGFFGWWLWRRRRNKKNEE